MMHPKPRWDVRSFVELWYQRHQANVRGVGGGAVPSCAKYHRVRVQSRRGNRLFESEPWLFRSVNGI